MGFLGLLSLVLFGVWLIVDNAMVFGRRRRDASRRNGRTILVVLVANWIGIAAAVALAVRGIGGLGAWSPVLQVAGLAVFLGGATTRALAIAQLGRFHMPDIGLQPGHRVVDSGLYRHVRHPSYLGAVLALAGFALALGSWLGALIVCALSAAAYLYRIEVEERVLLEGLGREYEEYRRRTRRLIPWIY